MKTVSDRIRWVIAHLKRTQPEADWSEGKLSEAAGLARSHISTTLRGDGERTTKVVIEKIAGAARVDAVWLQTGAGEPEPTTNSDHIDPPHQDEGQPAAPETHDPPRGPTRGFDTFGHITHWHDLVAGAKEIDKENRVPEYVYDFMATQAAGSMRTQLSSPSALLELAKWFLNNVAMPRPRKASRRS